MLFDIGFNIADEQWQGVYRGRARHAPDLLGVVGRAREAGVRGLLCTGTSLASSHAAVRLCREVNAHFGEALCFATVGVHPTEAGALKGAETLRALGALVTEARDVVRAWGECGLDYERLHWADAPTQRACFRAQLEWIRDQQISLPLFLHNRASSADFLAIFTEVFADAAPAVAARAVVHSFDEDAATLRQFLAAGFHIGLNGCSLRSQPLLDAVPMIPQDRLHLETDAPWCAIKPTSPAAALVGAPLKWKVVKCEKKTSEDEMVRGRNEPCAMQHVAMAAYRASGSTETFEAFCQRVYENSARLFGAGE